MSPELIGQLVLKVCFPLCLGVSILMALTYVGQSSKVLLRDLQVMVLITLGCLLFGLVFVNNDRLDPWLDLLTTKYITRYFWLGLGTIPALTWLWLRWRRGQ